MPNPTVADLTVEEFRELVREVVLQTLAELLRDPDQGLALREEFVAELQRSLEEVEAGEETIPAEEIATKLGLSW